MTEPRADDAAANEYGAEISDDGFDFGKFWHCLVSGIDDDRSFHSWMNAAMVPVGTGSGIRGFKGAPRRQTGRREGAVIGRDVMRDPSDGTSVTVVAGGVVVEPLSHTAFAQGYGHWIGTER